MHDLDTLLSLATKVATEAGDILREGRKREFKTSTKSSAVDIVTEIDHTSEDHIVQFLHAQRPEDSILGEEGTSIAGTSNVRWVVDPLDGTTNFTYGIPAYCVSIGVEIDGMPMAGVVYNPSTNELYSAAAGQGSFCNGERIQVRSEVPLSQALIATGFGYSEERRATQGEMLRKLIPQVRDIRRFGSAALDLCGVASGRTDGYYEWGLAPWDTAAGIVILGEAGGVVTGFDGLTPQPQQGIVAASCPSIHHALLEIVSTQL